MEIAVVGTGSDLHAHQREAIAALPIEKSVMVVDTKWSTEHAKQAEDRINRKHINPPPKENNMRTLNIRAQLAVAMAAMLGENWHGNAEAAANDMSNKLPENYRRAWKYTRDGQMRMDPPYVHTTKQQDDTAKLISRTNRMARFVRNRVIHCNSPTIFATASGN